MADEYRVTRPGRGVAPADWPLLRRLRLGAGYGLAFGAAAAAFEALLANWETGRAFSHVYPDGVPLGRALLYALLAPPTLGVVDMLLLPLYRHRWGAEAVGVLAALPFVLVLAAWAEGDSYVGPWQRAVIAACLLVLHVSFARAFRPDALGLPAGGPDAAGSGPDGRPSRPAT